MRHLRADWGGILDTRQWLLPELCALQTDLQEGVDPDDALETLGRILVRLIAANGVDLSTMPEGWDPPAGSTILEDEPVFLLRAKDAVSSRAVRVWALFALLKGADLGLGARASRWADEMDDYARAKREAGTWGPAHPPDAPALVP